MASTGSSRPTRCASPAGAPRSRAWSGRRGTWSSLTPEAFAQVAANLNFDMLASPNHAELHPRRGLLGYAAAGHGAGRQPGSRRHRGVLRGLLRRAGVTRSRRRSTVARTTSRSRTAASRPAACSRAPSRRSPPIRPAQWGGTVGLPFDPNYHQAGDTIDNLDPAGYETLADGGADVLARLATDPALRETLERGGSRTGLRCGRPAARGPSPSGRSTSARAWSASRSPHHQSREGRSSGAAPREIRRALADRSLWEFRCRLGALSSQPRLLPSGMRHCSRRAGSRDEPRSRRRRRRPRLAPGRAVHARARGRRRLRAHRRRRRCPTGTSARSRRRCSTWRSARSAPSRWPRSTSRRSTRWTTTCCWSA